MLSVLSHHHAFYSCREAEPKPCYFMFIIMYFGISGGKGQDYSLGCALLLGHFKDCSLLQREVMR